MVICFTSVFYALLCLLLLMVCLCCEFPPDAHIFLGHQHRYITQFLEFLFPAVSTFLSRLVAWSKILAARRVRSGSLFHLSRIYGCRSCLSLHGRVRSRAHLVDHSFGVFCRRAVVRLGFICSSKCGLIHIFRFVVPLFRCRQPFECRQVEQAQDGQRCC